MNEVRRLVGSLTDWRQYHLVDILLVCLVYVVSARVSQLFAIDPGNVTPVWIPSGLMIALALYKGPFIWPGVFLGAFLGNIWAYFSFASFSVAIQAFLAATFNGVGDVISTVGMATLLSSLIGHNYPFKEIKELVYYVVLAVIIGSLLSALIGVGGLTLFAVIPSENFVTVFMTWFIGDGVGALIFGPFLLSWLIKEEHVSWHYPIIFIFVTGLSGIIAAYIFGLLPLPIWTLIIIVVLMPVILMLIVYYGERLVFSVQTLISVIAILGVWLHKGFVFAPEIEMNLLQLQAFTAVLALVIYVIAVVIYERKHYLFHIEQQKRTLEKLYHTDALTGLNNRYRINDFLKQEFSRFKRHNTAFGVIMIDIDDFKLVNDEHGHNMGDKVLVRLSDLIEENVRTEDLSGRWGGEEFIIIVVDCNEQAIEVVAEKIRQVVESSAFPHEHRVTISLGASLVNISDEDEEVVVRRADKALYQSKKLNKNRYTFWTDSLAS